MNARVVAADAAETRRAPLPGVARSMLQTCPVSIDPFLTPRGLFAGTVVGLTGLGGAAIVTPMLLLLFNVPHRWRSPPTWSRLRS